MKKILSSIALLTVIVTGIMAQEISSENFQERYDALVKAVGPAGIGIETLLDKWEEAYPDDSKQHQCRFMLYYLKSQSETVRIFDKSKYLGQEPLLSLKDSLGNPVNYFKDTYFDDEIFGCAIKEIDKAIQKSPNEIDMRLSKISALMSYEKESPDMAASVLKGLIDYNFTQFPKWIYPGVEVNDELFAAMIQEYCVAFFRYATPDSYKAFRDISEKMLSYNPDNPIFMDNMGSYYLVAEKDNKMALKYYNKVLKKNPGDLTAITNCVILARNDKNIKLEKKYLPKLIEYTTDEATRKSAAVRLEALRKK